MAGRLAIVTRNEADESGEQTDDIVMSAVIAGDRAAFAELVDRYSDRAYGFALRILRNSAEAEDAVQEAFLKVWTEARRFDPERGRFASWFYRILHNLSVDRIRKKAPVPYEDLSEHASDAPDPEMQAAQTMQTRQITAALNALPERQRIAVQLCYFQGLSNREAAEVMDVGVKGLEALLVRARRQLAVVLGPVDNRDEDYART